MEKYGAWIVRKETYAFKESMWYVDDSASEAAIFSSLHSF